MRNKKPHIKKKRFASFATDIETYKSGPDLCRALCQTSQQRIELHSEALSISGPSIANNCNIV